MVYIYIYCILYLNISCSLKPLRLQFPCSARGFSSPSDFCVPRSKPNGLRRKRRKIMSRKSMGTCCNCESIIAVEAHLLFSSWWQLKDFLCSSRSLGNDPIWREYFSKGLKPPTRFVFLHWIGMIFSYISLLYCINYGKFICVCIYIYTIFVKDSVHIPEIQLFLGCETFNDRVFFCNHNMVIW